MDFFEFIEKTTGLWVYIAFVYVVDWIWDVMWFGYVDWYIKRLDRIIDGNAASKLDQLNIEFWSANIDAKLGKPDKVYGGDTAIHSSLDDVRTR